MINFMSGSYHAPMSLLVPVSGSTCACLLGIYLGVELLNMLSTCILIDNANKFQSTCTDIPTCSAQAFPLFYIRAQQTVT